MAHRVGIVGASGYGGAELLRLVDAHPGLEAATLAAGSSAGRVVSDLFPNIPRTDVFEAVDVDALAGLDLVFTATPHGASLDLVGQLADRDVPVIDLSGAFRLPAADFEAWYDEAHARPDLTDTVAVYGLTEWTRDRVAGAHIVANPGCYPTATLLGLLPLAPLVAPDTVVVDAKSGTSGAGRGVSERLHHPHTHGDVVAYGAPHHRHTGEIEHHLAALGGLATAISFTPHLMPTSRGLLATIYASLADDVGQEAVQDALVDRYRDEPFVRVLPPGTFPHTKALAGSNACHVSAVVDARTARVTVTSAIDNLGKGAAGQALQNANIMLGLDEALGLTASGVYP